MHDAIQLLNAGGERRWRTLRHCAKSSFCQLGTVHAEVGIQNASAKMPYDLVVDGLTGAHQFVSNPVGLNEVGA
jgi:hypothetical protein